MNYHGKVFRSVNNTPNGEVSEDTLFYYAQNGQVVTATYAGGGILQGQLIALVDGLGRLDMRYHHVNTQGQLQTGVCLSTPERLPDGRIRLHESWQWTSGDRSSGNSLIEEV